MHGSPGGVAAPGKARYARRTETQPRGRAVNPETDNLVLAHLRAIRSRQDEHSRELGEMRKRISSMERHLANVHDDLANVHGDLANVHGDVANVHARLDDHTERLRRIERRLEIAE